MHSDWVIVDAVLTDDSHMEPPHAVTAITSYENEAGVAALFWLRRVVPSIATLRCVTVTLRVGPGLRLGLGLGLATN